MTLKRLNGYKNVVCLGIGGGAIYYIAQIFHFLGAEIIGYDISKNERTKELENLGIHINYKNKTTFPKETDLIIYTNALSDNLINKIIKKNTKPLILEAGQFSKLLLNKIERNNLTNIEKIAVEKANFAPLFNYDLGKTKVIGVTGTDGKTTTSTMIYHMLKSLGYNPGLISTVSAKINNKDIDTGLHTTTPSAQELQKILQIMKDKKCTHIVLETTSHALDTGRVAGLKFDIAVYTNITNEHLDYHKTWLNYAKTKAKLLQSLNKNGKVLLNKDDQKSYKFLSKKSKSYKNIN
jgi:UDP-N-acetylmuramate-alanine ligase